MTITEDLAKAAKSIEEAMNGLEKFNTEVANTDKEGRIDYIAQNYIKVRKYIDAINSALITQEKNNKRVNASFTTTLAITKAIKSAEDTLTSSIESRLAAYKKSTESASQASEALLQDMRDQIALQDDSAKKSAQLNKVGLLSSALLADRYTVSLKGAASAAGAVSDAISTGSASSAGGGLSTAGSVLAMSFIPKLLGKLGTKELSSAAKGKAGILLAGITIAAAALFGVGSDLKQLQDRVRGTTLAMASIGDAEAASKIGMEYKGRMGYAAKAQNMEAPEVQDIISTLTSKLKYSAAGFDALLNSTNLADNGLKTVRAMMGTYGLTAEQSANTLVTLESANRRTLSIEQAKDKTTKDIIKQNIQLASISNRTGMSTNALHSAQMTVFNSLSSYNNSLADAGNLLDFVNNRSVISPATPEAAAQRAQAIAEAVRSMPLSSQVLANPSQGYGNKYLWAGMNTMEQITKTRGMLGKEGLFQSGDTPTQRSFKMDVAQAMTGISDPILLRTLLDSSIQGTKITQAMMTESEKQLETNWKQLNDNVGNINKIMQGFSAFFNLLKNGLVRFFH